MKYFMLHIAMYICMLSQNAGAAYGLFAQPSFFLLILSQYSFIHVLVKKQRAFEWHLKQHKNFLLYSFTFEHGCIFSIHSYVIYDVYFIVNMYVFWANMSCAAAKKKQIN
jgi:hypothetical protein